jgi:RimJ/RimL family protein N-acetyltransferase
VPDVVSNGTTREVALRPIDIDDWAAVHEWASTIEACRYQGWGPNTVAETKAFVAQAVSEWSHQQQDRYVWVAERQGAVIGLGELTVSSQRWRQGEVGYAVHVNHWGRGLGTTIARSLLTIAFDSMDLNRVWLPVIPETWPRPPCCTRLG